MTNRQREMNRLVERVRACRLCARMEGRTRVLGPDNGTIGARLMFVAEAPGRLGADRSGVPLSGDMAGRNFASLLAEAGINRSDVFVTNAVLCNPRDRSGNNTPPLMKEMRNCSAHLAETVRIVDPEIIVALGAVALKALGLIAAHRVVLSRDVGKAMDWNGRVLVPLYHPGPRALIWRPMEVQKEDYRRLGELVRR